MFTRVCHFDAGEIPRNVDFDSAQPDKTILALEVLLLQEELEEVYELRSITALSIFPERRAGYNAANKPTMMTVTITKIKSESCMETG